MHWLYHLWFGYFVPSLWGNGPEAVVQTFLYSAAAVLLIPPVRKWFTGHMKKLHQKLDNATKLARQHHQELLDQQQAHHDEALALARAHHAEHMATLKKQTAPRKPRGLKQKEET